MVGEVGVRAGPLGDDQIPELQFFAEGPGGAHPDDVLHAVEVEELVGVNADAGDAHAGGHGGNLHAVVGPRPALDAPDVVHQPGVFQKGPGNELCPEGVAGHEDGLGKRALGRLVVGSSAHISPPGPSRP